MPTIDFNIFAKAPTQHTGVPFVGYANFNGFRLGVSSDGLYQVCCGDTDAGTSIVGSFTPVETDFGITAPKRVEYVYVGFDSESDLVLTLGVDEKDSKTFVVPANAFGQGRTRIRVGRYKGWKGRYWTFKFENTSGAAFSINSVDVGFKVLSRGYK